MEKKVHPITLRKLTKPATLFITSLIILSMLSFFATPIQAESTASSGNTAIAIISAGIISYTTTASTPTPTPTPTRAPTATPTPTPTPTRAPTATPTPTPQPTTPPNGNNLAILGSNWCSFSNIVWDTSIKRNEAGSIRLDPVDSSGNAGRQAYDSNPDRVYPVHPGDHVYVSCYIRVGASSVGDASPYSGARMGLDIRSWQPGVGRYLLVTLESSVFQDNYPSSSLDTTQGIQNNYVNWGSTGATWVQRTFDFVIPSHYYSKDWYTGNSISPVQINEVALWFQIWGVQPNEDVSERGIAWFADAQLYINP